MEHVKLNRIDLDAKVDYKTHLVSGVVAAVVSAVIWMPAVYMLGKFLDYRFPVVEKEKEKTGRRHGTGSRCLANASC
ncbi:hypothetical protein MKW98_019620 [Papaver atlanticum]|uniref:Uncharacterized protein n=1 Tax=Papaver atlanticum TaxID=357466 RepID=A0AAD4XBK6_9MAGN|nr:hypothetical protein MKW98_019620 [Papaver atlanticum]